MDKEGEHFRKKDGLKRIWSLMRIGNISEKGGLKRVWPLMMKGKISEKEVLKEFCS